MSPLRWLRQFYTEVRDVTSLYRSLRSMGWKYIGCERKGETYIYRFANGERSANFIISYEEEEEGSQV